MGGRRRGCRSGRWLYVPARYRRRKSLAALLLFLAGTFSLRGWRAATMIDTESSRGDVGRRWTPGLSGNEGKDNQCKWQDNGPVLYSLSHSGSHKDASHWFRVAECFMGRRPEFKKYFAGMRGARVYIQDSDAGWTSRLTPMTRLFVAAGLTSVGVDSIHFIDGSHSSFSYSSGTDTERETGMMRGSGRSSGTPEPASGQIGVLRIDETGDKDQFVLSSDQPLPARLVDSASPPSPWGLTGRRGMRVDGGYEECVKFIGEVGSWGQDKAKWFPAEDDARALQLTLSEFCPIPWLRDEAQSFGDDVGDTQRVGGGSGTFSGFDGMYKGRVAGGTYGRRDIAGVPGHYNSLPRKVVIYQRDRNRRLLKTDEIALELYERLSHLGWSVTEIVHHPRQHPCEVVKELASADVLLTSYGFQSMLALFMRPESVLFEVFPHKYSATGYEMLANGLHLRYGSVESRAVRPFLGDDWVSRETCMRWRFCRSYARDSDVELSEDDLELVIELMLQGSRIR